MTFAMLKTRRHIALILSTSILVCISSACQAQDICAAWNLLVNDAPNNFSNSGPGNIPNGTCAADTSDPQNVDYECKLQFPDYASASQAYQKVIAAFQNCFPSIGVGNPRIHTMSAGRQIEHVNSNDFSNGAWFDFAFDEYADAQGNYALRIDVYPN